MDIKKGVVQNLSKIIITQFFLFITQSLLAQFECDSIEFMILRDSDLKREIEQLTDQEVKRINVQFDTTNAWTLDYYLRDLENDQIQLFDSLTKKKWDQRYNGYTYCPPKEMADIKFFVFYVDDSFLIGTFCDNTHPSYSLSDSEIIYDTADLMIRMDNNHITFYQLTPYFR